MNVDVDVAIVGGGPAGAIAARRLALSGMKVVLLERGGRLRDKTCGCCLAPRALPILEGAGVPSIAKAVALGETRNLRIHGAHGAQTRSELVAAGEPGGLLVPRDRFDQALRDAAAESGAIVMESTSARVRAIDRAGATLAVTHQTNRFNLQCRLLIGADGLGSAVARAAGLATRDSSGRKFGFAMAIAEPSDPAAVEPGAIEMFLVNGGYVGAVRLADGRVHCAALVARTHGSPAASPIRILRAAASVHPAIASMRLQDGADALGRDVLACGPMPWRPLGVATPSVALIGDAAGYVEPFTGEGMAWAIESAILLTDVIEAGGGAWCEVTAKKYAASWRERIGRRQWLCRMVAGALEHRSLRSLMLHAANAAPSVARRVIARAVAA